MFFFFINDRICWTRIVLRGALAKMVVIEQCVRLFVCSRFNCCAGESINHRIRWRTIKTSGVPFDGHAVAATDNLLLAQYWTYCDLLSVCYTLMCFLHISLCRYVGLCCGLDQSVRLFACPSVSHGHMGMNNETIIRVTRIVWIGNTYSNVITNNNTNNS